MNDEAALALAKLVLLQLCERTVREAREAMGKDREALSAQWAGFPVDRMDPQTEGAMRLEDATNNRVVPVMKALGTLARLGAFDALTAPEPAARALTPRLALFKLAAEARRAAWSMKGAEREAMMECARKWRAEAEAMVDETPPETEAERLAREDRKARPWIC